MTLQQAEMELSKINGQIAELLKKRENILKEWNIAFNTENSEDIACIDENIGEIHILCLVNGGSKKEVCRFSEWDMKQGINGFYKNINNLVALTNMANGRNVELPEKQKQLVYAKIAEIREQWEQKTLES